MVQMKEFRIVMPMTVEEYEVAVMYTIMKMEQQNTTGNEGVQILKNVPFEDEELGKGQFTVKLHHFQSKVPAWLKTFAPADAFSVQEESWNAYPRSRTVIKCQFFSKFRMIIDTIHIGDNGCSPNVHSLTDEQLAQRKVEIVDIASASTDYWSKVVGTVKVDFSKFRSRKTSRGPLLKGWRERCDPVMTAYKLVTTDAPYWGFGCRIEQTMLEGERALFLESHRRCFALIDEWFGMTMEEISELERQNDIFLNKTLKKTYPNPPVVDHVDGDQKQHEIVSSDERLMKLMGDGVGAKRVLEERPSIICALANRA